jgi:hypothetical protein
LETSRYELLTKYYSNDEIKDELGAACGKYAGKERRIQCFGGRPGEKRELKDLGVDGSIKMNLQEAGWRGMDWNDVAQYRDR